MTKKLAMTVGTTRRAVRNLVLFAAVTVAFGALGKTWTDSDTGYTGEYYIEPDGYGGMMAIITYSDNTSQ